MDKTVEQIAQETVAIHEVKLGLHEAAALVDEARLKLHEAQRRVARLTRFGAQPQLPPYAGLILDTLEDGVKTLNDHAFDVSSRLSGTGSRMEQRAANIAHEANVTVEQLAAAGLDVS